MYTEKLERNLMNKENNAKNRPCMFGLWNNRIQEKLDFFSLTEFF